MICKLPHEMAAAITHLSNIWDRQARISLNIRYSSSRSYYYLISRMVLKLYGTSISTCTNRVATVLKEKGIPYELNTVNLMQGEHKKPEFLQKQPFGQVPYIVRARSTHYAFTIGVPSRTMAGSSSTRAALSVVTSKPNIRSKARRSSRLNPKPMPNLNKRRLLRRRTSNLQQMGSSRR